ncbi:ABC exporter membrane fusion protein [Oculatella sp. LEGE 06141]|uniref:ABC exporter membrane fusion protein n=1 Tax=Oculatella sp. LEGE 06141 TaxID=1828648 RepID=UPI001882EC48|nr:ABC exporter membrane fusion protein [Oculatella sp. LEGE 06141]MBE9181911.1 ABC exporter membrane fusion protein [Oculatella sp. LEGE 06141]
MNFQQLLKPSNPWMLVLVIAGTVTSGAIAIYSVAQLKPSNDPVAVVAPPVSVRQITALGRLEPTTEVIKLSVPATLNNDRVAELRVQRGDRVETGQVIAVLDSRNRLQSALLEVQEQLKVAQAELVQVKAGVKAGEIAAQRAEIAELQADLKGEVSQQQAAIARWQAEVNTATAEYDRYVSLYQEGAISASDLDQRQLDLETTQAQLNEAKAGQQRAADSLQEQIRQAEATLDQLAEVRPVDVQVAQARVDQAIAAVKKAEADLAEAFIQAPITGRILDIYANPGEVVGEKGIAELGQTSQMQVVAEIYQTDINQVRDGQLALITSNSFPGELQGTVSFIGLQVNQQEVTSGEPGENLDRKVINVRIQLNPRDSQRVADLTNLQVQVAIQPERSSINR